jgi:hypothetical protein
MTNIVNGQRIQELIDDNLEEYKTNSEWKEAAENWAKEKYGEDSFKKVGKNFWGKTKIVYYDENHKKQRQIINDLDGFKK